MLDSFGKNALHYRKAITMCGLVVMRASDGRPGFFTRFGAWEIIFNVGSYDELMELFSAQSESLMDEAFENGEGIARYAITLI